MISFYGRGGMVSDSSGGAHAAQIFTDTKENWAKQTSLLSKLNTIYIYSDYKTQTREDGTIVNIPGMKIGDGLAYVVDLPFVGDIQIASSYLVSVQDRAKWDQKVAAAISESDGENLILYNN